jgi:hypothetical protein
LAVIPASQFILSEHVYSAGNLPKSSPPKFGMKKNSAAAIRVV